MAAETQKRASRRPQGRLIGYARVSTDEQATEAQEIELRSVGSSRSTAPAHRAPGRLSASCCATLAPATPSLSSASTALRAPSAICSR